VDFKNILLHLDHSSGCSNRLETAFGLARKYDALITGLFVVPDYVVPSYVEAQISVDLITDVTEKAIARAKEKLAEYQKLADDAGVSMESQVIEGQVIPILREHSKYADLLMLGQDQPDDPERVPYVISPVVAYPVSSEVIVLPWKVRDGQSLERLERAVVPTATRHGRCVLGTRFEFGELGWIIGTLQRRGMRASGKKTRGATFSDYQEIRIRHFHKTLDLYLGTPAR